MHTHTHTHTHARARARARTSHAFAAEQVALNAPMNAPFDTEYSGLKASISELATEQVNFQIPAM
jgi:hypothetical protein